MKGIVWNCRGMGRPDFISNFTYLISLIKLDFLYFVETKIVVDKAPIGCFKRYFDQFFGSDPDGRFGGICVCWNSGLINLNVISASSRYIHALVKDFLSNIEYLATFVHVYPQKYVQANMLEDLLALNLVNEL